MKTCTIHVRQRFPFPPSESSTDGKELAPFVLFLSSSSLIENLTWSIFHFLLLHIWFWHLVVIGIVSFELLLFLF